MKIIPIFTRVNTENLSFWSNIEKSLNDNISFKLIEFKETFHKSIYGQCIIADISTDQLEEVIYFQRIFSLPYLFVSNSTLTAQQQIKILESGALDILSAPISAENIKAKVLYHFGSLNLVENEKMISKASLTKVEEQILRVILSKSIKTTAENIYKHIWKDSSVQIKTFNVHVSKLRKKLKTIDLDVKCLKDKSYHVIKKRSLQADVEKIRSL